MLLQYLDAGLCFRQLGLSLSQYSVGRLAFATFGLGRGFALHGHVFLCFLLECLKLDLKLGVRSLEFGVGGLLSLQLGLRLYTKGTNGEVMDRQEHNAACTHLAQLLFEHRHLIIVEPGFL